MDCDIAHGYRLIVEIVRQKNERDAFGMYYFAQPNGINGKYQSHKDLLPRAAERQKTRSAQDIFDEIHQKMSAFMGRKG